MAQSFPETAHLNVNQEKYQAEHERIFGSKKRPCGYCNDAGIEANSSDRCRRGCDLSSEIIEDAKALCPELLESFPSVKITFPE